jgi:hypothetical protein
MTVQWSSTKLQASETCPLRHYEVDIRKNYQDRSQALIDGDAAHKAFEAALRTGGDLPADLHKWRQWLEEPRRHEARGAEILVEKKFGLTKDLEPCEFFGETAWYRGILDHGALYHEQGVGHLTDWKTGKSKHDCTQLMLMAQCVFIHYPTMRTLRARYVWFKEAAETVRYFERAQMGATWAGLLPRVEAYQNMIDRSLFPPKPSALCFKHCPVRSCEYHGRGRT